MQKENVDSDGEKGVQISVVAKKILTQGWSEIIIMKYKHNICFLISRYYDMLWFDQKAGIRFTGYFYF